MPEEYDPKDEDLSTPPSFFPSEPGEDDDLVVEVELQGVFAVVEGDQPRPFVALESAGRRLDIAIDMPQAEAISLAIEEVVPERPHTHDLLRSTVDAMGGKVHSIVIADLWDGIYFARIYIQQGEREHELDARPSDAIALAVRSNAPIYVAERLMP